MMVKKNLSFKEIFSNNLILCVLFMKIWFTFGVNSFHCVSSINTSSIIQLYIYSHFAHKNTFFIRISFIWVLWFLKNCMCPRFVILKISTKFEPHKFVDILREISLLSSSTNISNYVKFLSLCTVLMILNLISKNFEYDDSYK